MSTEQKIRNDIELDRMDIALIVFKINRIFLAVLTSIWSSYYISFWKRQQEYFTIQFGMSDFENTENKRPSFTGDFVRNLSNGAYNVLQYSTTKRFWKTLFTYFMILCLLVVSILLTIACLSIRTDLDKITNDPLLLFFFPATLNFLVIKVLDALFHKVVRYF